MLPVDSNIHRHATATTTSASVYGRKRTVRKAAMPRIRLQVMAVTRRRPIAIGMNE
jgi:hypothetical protein